MSKIFNNKLTAALILALIMAGGAAITANAAPVLMPEGIVFDAEFYGANNPDVVLALGSSDPILLYSHYLQIGHTEGRLPASPGAQPVSVYAPPSPQKEEAPLPDAEDADTDISEEEEDKETEDVQELPETKDVPSKTVSKTGSDDKRNAVRNFLSTVRKKRSGAAASVEEYYKDSVFVGDSIMLGFRNYSMKRPNDPLLSELSFLAAGSFGANNALKPVNKTSVHPVYKGEQRFIWESISMMGSKKVFILMGLNDLNVAGLEGSLKKYEELLSKIEQASPGVRINIISMPYVLAGSEKGKLNNNSIREYNTMLKAMTSERGYGYVDIASKLSDKNGNLDPKYCSDGFLHQTPAAYDVWVQILREYADVI